MRSTAHMFRCLFGACTLLVSTGWAQVPQQTGSTRTASASKAKHVEIATASDEIVSFEFPGGTLSSFIEKLREAAAPLPLNVFIEPEAAKQLVPPVKLTNVSYYYVLRLLDRTAKDDQGRMVQTQLEQSNTPDGAALMFKIRAIELGGSHADGFSVLSLNPIIGLPGSTKATTSSLDAKTVLAAIEAAVTASEDQGASPPMLKFHESSGLLFVRGTSEQREAASEVVQQLRRDVDAERAADLAATGGRDTKKMLIKSQPAEDVAEAVRRQLIGKCCVQLEVDGKYIVITGDKALVAEAAQRAYAIDGMPRPSTPAPNSDAK